MVYRYGIWISIPVFAGSVALVIYCIMNVIRVSRQSQILSVPVIGQQEVGFPEAGEVILCVQGPQLSTRFGGLSYELSRDSIVVPGRPTLGQSQTSGFSWVRVDMRVYRIPAPGKYTLRISGLEPGASPDNQHSIVFTRPNLMRSLPYILGIVFGGIIFIGSIVFFFIRLSSPGIG